MRQYLSLLSGCPLFRQLSPDFIESSILPQARVQEYPKGAFLIHPQQQLNYFGIVAQGAIHTIHLSADGDNRIMDSLEPGQLYGADLMCTRSRLAPYHAMAAQPCTVLQFPIGMVLEPGTLPEPERQTIIAQLLTIIAHENMRKDYRLAILSHKGLRERLMTYLTMQAAKWGTATFSIPFDREALASFLCVNRSALSHEIAAMRKEGIIDCRKNTFTLLNQQEKGDQLY